MKKLLLVLTTVLGLAVAHAFGQCSVTLTAQPDPCGLCQGSINSSPTGQSPFSFLWSTGQTTQNISGLCPGVYSVTVTDANACTASASAPVTAGFFNAFVTPTNATCNGCCDGTATATVSGGFPPYTYSWSCSGQTASSITGLCTGNCVITVTDSIGCSIVQMFTITEPPAGIYDQIYSTSINIFPNPFSTHTTLQTDNLFHNATLTVYNCFGQEVYPSVIRNSDSFVIRRDNLASGLYFVRITHSAFSSPNGGGQEGAATGKLIITD